MAEFGAVLYHYLTGAPGVDGPLTQGTVAVDVVLQTDPQDDVSGAGLLFDFQETTGDYFAFVATASGYALYRRDSDGLRALASESAEAVAPGTLRRLTARTAGSLVELYLDGAFVLGLETEVAMDGGVGIVAIGVGTFAYHAFGVLRP